MEDAQIAGNGVLPSKMSELSPPPAVPSKSCALCGCSTPAVRCDRCSSQIFCLSCDDMYHRHPKRRTHLRKALDSIWSSQRSPRLRRRTELPGDPTKIPIPPPRAKKRTFPKAIRHELGSFGYSKVFDARTLPPPVKDPFMGRKTPTSVDGNYENEGIFSSPHPQKDNDIYENENVPMSQDPLSRSPWNLKNVTSPIQVAIPSTSPDLMGNGQSFGYPTKPHSRSFADIPSQPPFHPYYPHVPCPQCVTSASWSNLHHPSPYFHPMPWGSMPRPPHPNGDGSTFPDPNFPFPYPGAPFFPNGMVLAESSVHRASPKVRKSRSVSREPPSRQDGAQNSNPVDAEMEESEAVSPKAPTPTAAVADDETPKVPAKPKQPWACMHCTFINPAGILICQVCCKTSYGVQEGDERNSESPMELVNMDAIRQSPTDLKVK